MSLTNTLTLTLPASRQMRAFFALEKSTEQDWEQVRLQPCQMRRQ